MTTLVTMTVGSHVATIELLTEAAPRTCKAFLDLLPIDTFTVHAKFAGDELIAMLPFFEDLENTASSVDPGDIGYYPNRQTLCLFYGEILPFGTVSAFARVVSGLEEMRLAALEVKEHGTLSTRIELAGPASADRSNGTGGWTHESASAAVTPDGAGGRDGALSPASLTDFLRANWLEEPADVTRLRALHKPPLGNRPCVFYANFDLFWLGENLLVCREHLRAADWPVAQVAAMTATLARCTAERLAKWGFADTVAMLRGATETLTARPDVEAGALLAYLNALLLAAGRVQAWVDAAIPWGALDAAVTLHETPSTRIPA